MLRICTNYIVIVTWTLSFFGEGNIRGQIKIFLMHAFLEALPLCVPATTTSPSPASPAGWATCQQLIGINKWQQIFPINFFYLLVLFFSRFPVSKLLGFCLLLFWSNVSSFSTKTRFFSTLCLQGYLLLSLPCSLDRCSCLMLRGHVLLWVACCFPDQAILFEIISQTFLH